MRQAFVTDAAPQPQAAFSQAIGCGDIVACAGQTGVDPATGQVLHGLEEQTTQALNNLSSVLRAAGCGWEDVIKTTCFLADIDQFTIFNRAYAAVVPQPWPARSTIGVRMAAGLLVEIEAIAVRASVRAS